VIGLDWGIGDPFCALWTAIDEVGDKWTYRELYARDLMEDEQAMLVRDSTGRNEEIESVFYDPSMDHQTHGRQKTRQAVIKAYRHILGPDKRFGGMIQGDNTSRIMAWRNMNMMMNYDTSAYLPNWHIEEGCLNLIREVESARYKTSGGVWCDDIDPRLPDHALTASAYHLLPTMQEVSTRPLRESDLYIVDERQYIPETPLDDPRKRIRM